MQETVPVAVALTTKGTVVVSTAAVADVAGIHLALTPRQTLRLTAVNEGEQYPAPPRSVVQGPPLTQTGGRIVEGEPVVPAEFVESPVVEEVAQTPTAESTQV